VNYPKIEIGSVWRLRPSLVGKRSWETTDKVVVTKIEILEFMPEPGNHQLIYFMDGGAEELRFVIADFFECFEPSPIQEQ